MKLFLRWKSPCRQETALDGILLSKGHNDETKGCRVFGDCDIFMKELMKCIYPSDELETWESQRAERMKVYDSKREWNFGFKGLTSRFLLQVIV